MKHDVLPRVKEFDQDKLRRMTTMSTDVGVPEPSFRFINGNASISHLRNHTLTVENVPKPRHPNILAAAVFI